MVVIAVTKPIIAVVNLMIAVANCVRFAES
jgi:hypothetical protein